MWANISFLMFLQNFAFLVHDPNFESISELLNSVGCSADFFFFDADVKCSLALDFHDQVVFGNEKVGVVSVRFFASVCPPVEP
jgi:hypothetical protein